MLKVEVKFDELQGMKGGGEGVGTSSCKVKVWVHKIWGPKHPLNRSYFLDLRLDQSPKIGFLNQE